MAVDGRTVTGRGAGAPVPRRAPAPLLPDVAMPVEPLTARELEVLGHLAELMSTQEIAEAMFVSVNTVRTHIRGLLRKLSAARRNDAVRRAWDLGLIQRHSDSLLPPPPLPVGLSVVTGSG